MEIRMLTHKLTPLLNAMLIRNWRKMLLPLSLCYRSDYALMEQDFVFSKEYLNHTPQFKNIQYKFKMRIPKWECVKVSNNDHIVSGDGGGCHPPR